MSLVLTGSSRVALEKSTILSELQFSHPSRKTKQRPTWASILMVIDEAGIKESVIEPGLAPSRCSVNGAVAMSIELTKHAGRSEEAGLDGGGQWLRLPS